MEIDMNTLRPMGGRYSELQYAFAAALIWGAVGFGVWAQAHPVAQDRLLLLALQPASNVVCDPS